MGFCNNIISTCDTCLAIVYGLCGDVLTISVDLTPLTTYYLNLIDKFDIVTQISVTTDAVGDFTITQTWTQYTGAVEIQIFSDAARTNQVNFSQGGVTYDCIVAQHGVLGEVFCSNQLKFAEPCNSQYLIIP